MLNDKRIRIIIGHYGSGKTEFAVNYAMKLAAAGRKTALADMDIVNPYFRSREKAAMMTAQGIRVISGNRGHDANLDLPMVSADVLSPLQDAAYDLVLDVGGNEVGARVIAQFHAYFKEGAYDMFCVVNRYREDTTDVAGVMTQIRTIEATVGAPVTGLINNTHLLHHTTAADVMYGQELVEEVSAAYNIPVRYVSALESIVPDLPANLQGEIFPLKMYMRETWMTTDAESK